MALPRWAFHAGWSADAGPTGVRSLLLTPNSLVLDCTLMGENCSCSAEGFNRRHAELRDGGPV
jgi:hypothetical protein